MEVTIKGEPKEIAALVLGIQERHMESDIPNIGFPSIDGSYCYAYNLVAKNDDVPDCNRGSE